MKAQSTLPKLMAILFFIIAIASCDEDFNTIGGEIVGDDSLLSELDETSTVIAYSRKLAPVQTTNMPMSKIGIYNDGTFGKSTINYITQLSLSVENPIFADELGQEIVLDSVILYIPYYSNEEVEVIDEEDVTTYTLDSVYGDSPIKIEMFESGYFLRDLDPESGFEDPQLYYSNQGDLFEGFLGENLTTIEDFVPSNEGFVLTVTTEGQDGEEDVIVETLVSPGIRVALSNDFFQEKIFDKEGDPVLSNDNNFKDYFRGLYFKMSSNTESGSMFNFNQNTASITMYYHFDRTEEVDGVEETSVINSEYALNFGGVNLNVYNNNLSSDVASAIENPDTENGTENLYIRGGDGILTVINLFGDDVDDNNIADELEILRERNWLINDANLKFYVDQSKIVGGETEPERITIFNIDNNTILADYFLDPTSGNQPVDAVTDHLGRLERGSDENGVSYTINITHHISNLINKDSTNVSLGLMVSQNVLVSGVQKLDTLADPNLSLPTIETVQRNSVFSHEGTVLYGNNTLIEEKKLKLQIYYTEPN